MTYKNIAVWLDAKRDAPAEVAMQLAQDFGAHLVGLNHFHIPRLPPYVQSYVGEDIARARIERASEEARAACAVFSEAAVRRGITGAEARTLGGDPVNGLATNARYADLVVMGQPDPQVALDPADLEFPDHAILACGRPVLMVPYTGSFKTIGNHAVVAWSATREATRAVTDALPLLTRAKKVTVITGDASPSPDGHGASPGADIALYLARHGVQVTVSREAAAGLDIGALLLSRIADLDADLLVMGAYGHSRLRELVLGGVTRTILQSMTVPVLMSH